MATADARRSKFARQQALIFSQAEILFDSRAWLVLNSSGHPHDYTS